MPAAELQWGHGDEAVEEVVTAGSGTVSITLQWGHGDEAVEEADRIAAISADALLQWGHGDEAVEESADQVEPGHDSAGFNGATAMKPWKSCLTSLGLAADVIASMGPRR